MASIEIGDEMNGATMERKEQRVPTGVPGLDAILHGGLLRKGVYIIQGRPGAGKTTLANQICFHHIAQGGHVVYATLLAETHERMLYNLESFRFFDREAIPEKLTYLSAFAMLEDGGLKGLLEVLRREARTRKSSLLVVDGLVAAEESARSANDYKKFIHELQIHANLLSCTVLLLTSGSPDSVQAEHTMVDGFVELSDNRVGRSSERELEVKKFRGSDFLRGGHSFQITHEGVTVYPRLEGLLSDPSKSDVWRSARVSTGVDTLDRMIQGGLPESSSTTVFGSTGTGKTTIGLHFLSRSSAREPGLLFGFYESPQRIFVKAKALGLDLEGKVERGELAVLWHPSTERILDALGGRLLKAVRERGVKRLFVDGIEGFIQAAVHPERISHFLAALTNELRVLGVTTVFTTELPDLFGTRLALPTGGISSLVENVFLMRFIEQRSHLRRVFSVIKLRDSAYDDTVREVSFSDKGFALGEPAGMEPKLQ